MFESLKTRFVVIGILIALCVWALWPRTVINDRNVNGVFVQDTIRQKINLKLGLDLQGGMHLALELDESRGAVANRAEAIERALRVIRTRIDEFGVTEPLVQAQGDDRIVVELAGISDPQRAKDIVQRAAFLEFQMTDKEGLFRNALNGIDRALTAAGVTEASVGRRVAADSAAGAAPQPAAPGSALEDILGAAPGADTAAQAADTAQADTLGSPATAGPLQSLLFGGQMPGEYLVAAEKVAIVDGMMQHPAARRLMPRGIVMRWGSEETSRGARAFRPLYALQERAIMTGEMLTDAQARLDPIYNQAVVDFQLNRRGGRIFERETGLRVGDYMAIVLDGRVQSTPPVIRSQIGSRGQIELSGSSLQEAQDLALVLKAGALPVPLIVVEERTVGSTLGEDSIRSSRTAGIAAVALIIIILVVYYRFTGVLAVTALGFYVLLTLGALAAMDATLTLPGVAGLVLSIGMAVDANVLIFERIREELALGKSVRLAIDAGFRMPLNAIVDSNVTTVLTAAFLFQFGTGPVRGFAVTLIIGIMASMVSAVFVTRTLFLLYLERKPGLQTVSI